MRLKLASVLFAALLFMATSEVYGQMRNITLMSYEIVSFNVLSEKVTLNITVENDSTEFTIKSITGLVYKNGVPLVSVTTANLYVPQGVSTIGVVCSVSRCSSVSFIKLVQCMLLFDIRDYSADVSAAIQYPSSGILYREQKNVILSKKVTAR